MSMQITRQQTTPSTNTPNHVKGTDPQPKKEDAIVANADTVEVAELTPSENQEVLLELANTASTRKNTSSQKPGSLGTSTSRKAQSKGTGRVASSLSGSISPAKFGQLAKSNPQAATKLLQGMIKRGQHGQAAKLVGAMLGGTPQEASLGQQLLGQLGNIADSGAPRVARQLLLPFLDKLAANCATYGPRMSQAMSAMMGVAGMLEIARFFKTVGSWLIDNYNAANKTHTYTGSLDALAQFHAKAASQKGPLSQADTQKIIAQLTQAYEQKCTQSLQQRHGSGVNLNTTGKSHLVQTDIDQHKLQLEAYKKGLQFGLQQYTETGRSASGTLVRTLVKGMAQKEAGSTTPDVSDYRKAIKTLLDKQLSQNAGL